VIAMETTKTSPFVALGVLVALSGLVGGCGLSVEADLPDVEITKRDLAFPGMPASTVVGDAAMTRSFTQQHAKLALPDHLNSDVEILGVRVVAKRGVSDLSFIHDLRVTLSAGAQQGTPVELVSYHDPSNASAGTVLEIANTTHENASNELRTDAATFTVEVAGSLPQRDWAIDLAIRFSAKLRYR